MIQQLPFQVRQVHEYNIPPPEEEILRSVQQSMAVSLNYKLSNKDKPIEKMWDCISFLNENQEVYGTPKIISQELKKLIPKLNKNELRSLKGKVQSFLKRKHESDVSPIENLILEIDPRLNGERIHGVVGEVLGK